jgi:hypothetical protein
MIQHIILVLQGGGAKGPIQLGELTVLEDKLKTNIAQKIDAIVTTSIGAVEGSILTVCNKLAKDVWTILESNLKNIFTPKHFWSFPRLQFSSYINLYDKSIGDAFKFGDATVKLVMTTVGMTNAKNHFFKSWHEKDANFNMTSIACRSFAAPLFFGGIEDNVTQEVYLDGGTGLCNLPLVEAYCEAVAQGWLKDGHSTHILALGTGSANYDWTYNQCTKGWRVWQLLKQIFRFISIGDGGLARLQSTMYQVNVVNYLAKYTPNLTMQWVDWYPMPKKLDQMDNWKARKIYYEKGLELGQTIDIQPFLRKM